MTSHDMGRRTCDVMWHSLRTCHATCVMTQGGSGVHGCNSDKDWPWSYEPLTAIGALADDECTVAQVVG